MLLSAVVLTFNEERNIGRCLTSLAGLADELLVVDSFSTDQTVTIAKQFGARVVQRTFEGYVEQKNAALELASHPWVLSLDADECLSVALQREIADLKEHEPDGVFELNRLTNYAGRWVWHCGWHPEHRLRLFRKTAGRWGGLNPHDRFELNGPQKMIRLKGLLLHYSFYSVAEHYEQMRRFSTLAAEARYKEGRRAYFFSPWANSIAKFLKGYVLKSGWADGLLGFQICWRSALAVKWRYEKLLNLQRSA